METIKVPRDVAEEWLINKDGSSHDLRMGAIHDMEEAVRVGLSDEPGAEEGYIGAADEEIARQIVCAVRDKNEPEWDGTSALGTNEAVLDILRKHRLIAPEPKLPSGRGTYSVSDQSSGDFPAARLPEDDNVEYEDAEGEPALDEKSRDEFVATLDHLFYCGNMSPRQGFFRSYRRGWDDAMARFKHRLQDIVDCARNARNEVDAIESAAAPAPPEDDEEQPHPCDFDDAETFGREGRLLNVVRAALETFREAARMETNIYSMRTDCGSEQLSLSWKKLFHQARTALSALDRLGEKYHANAEVPRDAKSTTEPEDVTSGPLDRSHPRAEDEEDRILGAIAAQRRERRKIAGDTTVPDAEVWAEFDEPEPDDAPKWRCPACGRTATIAIRTCPFCADADVVQAALEQLLGDGHNGNDPALLALRRMRERLGDAPDQALAEPDDAAVVREALELYAQEWFEGTDDDGEVVVSPTAELMDDHGIGAEESLAALARLVAESGAKTAALKAWTDRCLASEAERDRLREEIKSVSAGRSFYQGLSEDYRKEIGRLDAEVAAAEAAREKAEKDLGDLVSVIAKESHRVGVTHENSPNDAGELKRPAGIVRAMAYAIKSARDSERQAREKAEEKARTLGEQLAVAAEKAERERYREWFRWDKVPHAERVGPFWHLDMELEPRILWVSGGQVVGNDGDTARPKSRPEDWGGLWSPIVLRAGDVDAARKALDA